MDEQFKKEVVTRLDSIDANLERHMKRSDALEAQVVPMHDALLKFEGAVHFIKLVAALAGIVELVRLFYAR